MSNTNAFDFSIDELNNDSFFADDNEISKPAPKKQYSHWMDSDSEQDDDDNSEIEDDTLLDI